MRDAEPATIRLLLLEDSPSAAQDLLEAMAREGLEFAHARVTDEGQLRDALRHAHWDILIASDSLRELDCSRVLEIALGHDRTLPCVLLGYGRSFGPALGLLRSGARDYVERGDTAWLAAVIQRELSASRAQRSAEARLRAARDQAHAIVEGIAMPLVTLDSGGHILSANPAFLRHFADDRGLVTGRPLSAVLNLPPDDPWLSRIGRAADDQGLGEHEVELDVARERRTFVAAAQRIAAADGEQAVLLVSLRDITEGKASARQVEEAQRMEAIGRLAGGVAHDFNNLLTVVQSYASFLTETLAGQSQALEDVLMIKDATSRAAQLTSQLLAFSRRQVQSLEVLDLNCVLSNLGRMLSRVIGEDLELVTRLDPNLGPIQADVAQLEQILMNLVINARDAMPQGGKIVVETANVTRRRGRVDSQGALVPAGRYVRLSVTDTGVGMDEAACSRVFEPFFTTKERGTGLGLSTVYGIVKQSNGHIAVSSRPGRGTTFRILFPRIDSDEPRIQAQPRSDRPAGGSETVLLVEDEVNVRRAAARILKRHGYHVVEAESPAQALSLWLEQADRVELLVSDLVMPGMSGRELAQCLRKRRPHLPVLFISGYSDDDTIHSSNRGAPATYLQKPFTPHALLKKVREAFDM